MCCSDSYHLVGCSLYIVQHPPLPSPPPQGKMLAHDRLEADRAVARNAVEEYVYDMRDKLGEQLQEYISQEVRGAPRR